MAVKNDADCRGGATVCAVLTVLTDPGTDRQYGTLWPLSYKNT